MDTVATGIIVATTSCISALGAWAMAKAQIRTSKTSEHQMVLEGFKGLMNGYETQLAGMRTQISSLEDLVRGLSAHVMDLEDALAKRGMPIPPRSYPLALIAGGKHDD